MSYRDFSTATLSTDCVRLNAARAKRQ